MCLGTRLLMLAAASAATAAAAPPAVALEGPCDLFARGGTPCQAAHSLTRALYGAYEGPLYQVMRMSDGAQQDVRVRAGSGVADSAAQDSFCGAAFCMVHRIYDQSPNGNHLELAPPGGAARVWDRGVNATAHRVLVKDGASGQPVPVYGARFEPGMGYRADRTKGIAVGDEPETMYAVLSGRIYNDRCCFDYGNAETDNLDHGEGTMEALYFGSSVDPSRGTGAGPWVMADLENGLWAGKDRFISSNTPLDADFVTGMLKGDSQDHFALKGGDAADAGGLKLKYDGARPANPKYKVMKKQGAIILGIGGDNSNSAAGAFYEGVMTSGFSTDEVDAQVHANIAGAGYALPAADASPAGGVVYA